MGLNFLIYQIGKKKIYHLLQLHRDGYMFMNTGHGLWAPGRKMCYKHKVVLLDGF